MSVAFSKTLASLAAAQNRRNLFFPFLIFSIFVAWCLWFFFVPIALYSVSNEARLKVKTNIQPVHALTAGRIASVNMHLGDTVVAGEVLITLNSEPLRLELAASNAKRVAIVQEHKALQGELVALVAGQAFNSDEADATIAVAKARVTEAKAHQRFTAERLARFEQLISQGGVSELDVIEARAEAKKAQAVVNAVSKERLRIGKFQAARQSDRAAGRQHLLSEIARLARTQVELDAEITALKYNIEQHLIRAPFAGKIGEAANVYVGMPVAEGERLGAFVPAGQLHVDAYFSPSSAFGRITAGQVGRLMFDGFPWTQYGKAHVQVERIAEEVRDGRVQVSLSIQLAADSAIPLQHGMPATVEIETEQLVPAILVLRAAGKLLRNE